MLLQWTGRVTKNLEKYKISESFEGIFRRKFVDLKQQIVIFL